MVKFWQGPGCPGATNLCHWGTDMTFHKTIAAAALITAFSVAGAHASTITSQTFDADVTRSDTQAPGTWYTDRYNPAGFEGGVMFDGDNRLKHSIAAADGANTRPGGFGSAFYNTQGRKFDTGGAISMAIDLYIPQDWATANRRMAGFWGTGLNAGSVISYYPIIEFASDNDDPRFQVWNGLGWSNIGLPTGFAYDSWYRMTMDLVGGDVVYTVGDLTETLDSNGTVEFSNVILQGYNTTDGVSYDIYWDNFTAAAIPVPAALPLLGGGLALLGFMGWRKRRAAA